MRTKHDAPCAVHVPVDEKRAVRDRPRAAKARVREAVPRARPAGAGLVRDDEPLSAFPAHPRQPALEAAMRKAEHRPHGPRPDLPPLPGAHVPGLEGRKENHVEGPAEIAGNPPVQVVHQVADADGEPVDPLPVVALPFPVPCLRALSGRTAELQQERSHLVRRSWRGRRRGAAGGPARAAGQGSSGRP